MRRPQQHHITVGLTPSPLMVTMPSFTTQTQEIVDLVERGVGKLHANMGQFPFGEEKAHQAGRDVVISGPDERVALVVIKL